MLENVNRTSLFKRSRDCNEKRVSYAFLLKRLNIDFNAINCAKGKSLLSTIWAVRDDEKLLVDDRVFLGTSVYEGRRKVLQGWLVPPGESIVRNTLIKNPFPGSAL